MAQQNSPAADVSTARKNPKAILHATIEPPRSTAASDNTP